MLSMIKRRVELVEALSVLANSAEKGDHVRWVRECIRRLPAMFWGRRGIMAPRDLIPLLILRALIRQATGRDDPLKSEALVEAIEFGDNFELSYVSLRHVRKDRPLAGTEHDVYNTPLIHPVYPEVDEFYDEYLELSKTFRDWRGMEFWWKWYDGFFHGRPLDFEFQGLVADLPDAIWVQGADAVGAAIAEIEAKFLAESLKPAEDVEFDARTNRFFVTPLPMQNPAFMSALMERTEDALDDALHGNNGLREDMREVRVLRRTHSRYANNPQRVEMDYVSVAISLRRNLEAKELADSEDNLALLDAVEEGARGLRAHHPEVAANRESLARQALRELAADDVILLEDAADLLPEISKGEMQEDFQRDIPQLINDAMTPLPSGAPPLPGMDEATRIFSRSAKMRLRLSDLTQKGASVFDSKEVKTVRLGLTVGGLLTRLVSLGLRLFGIL